MYSQAKKHPTIVIPIIEGSALAGQVKPSTTLSLYNLIIAFITGACGTILGVGISTYRKLPVHIYAISLGANFAITTLSFLGTYVHYNRNSLILIPLTVWNNNELSIC